MLNSQAHIYEGRGRKSVNKFMLTKHMAFTLKPEIVLMRFTIFFFLLFFSQGKAGQNKTKKNKRICQK